MALPLQQDKARFTYADYLTWPADERWELIDGAAYNMTPAPSRNHQEISIVLANRIFSFLSGKPCKVYTAPFDVRLADDSEAADEHVGTVVQPDLVVICDRSKLDDRGCKGAPDLVVEIISRESASRDMKEKLSLYERYGVREYWIISPFEQIVWLYRLNESRAYGKPDIYAEKDFIKSLVLDGLDLQVERIFDES
jgi:Uma2 family endonuclease